MITTKSCSTCEHFPNDHHCVGCVWDEAKGENTKWELKENPIVIERSVLDKIRAEIEQRKLNSGGEPNRVLAFNVCLQIIDKYKTEVEPQERSEE